MTPVMVYAHGGPGREGGGRVVWELGVGGEPLSFRSLMISARELAVATTTLMIEKF